MARRRRRVEDGGYDSVLDTMTNVVGILIVVAAVTQLGVADAVGRATRGPDAERGAKARERRRGLEASVGELEGAFASGGKELERSEEELERLQRQAREARQRNEDLAELEGPGTEELQRSVDEKEDELGDLQGESDAYEAELRRLRRVLAGLSDPPKPAMSIRLPDPDPDREKGKTFMEFLCKGGKLYPLDMAATDKKCNVVMSRIASGSGSSLQKIRNVVRHFDTHDVGDRYFRVRYTEGRKSIGLLGTQTMVYLVQHYELRSGARGLSLEDLGSPGSEYLRIIRGLDPRKKAVMFRVYEDAGSFEVYLLARRLLDERAFAAGWIPYKIGEPMSFHLIGGGGGGDWYVD